MFINVTRDVLIFTDRSRAAGGLLADPAQATATLLSSGLVRLLEREYLAREGTSTRSLADARPVGARAGARADDENLGFLQAFARNTPGFALGSSAQPLGPLTAQSHDVDGVLRLGEWETWRPAGTVTSRTVGAATLHFVVSNLDLQGAVAARADLGAASVGVAGPQLQVTASGCTGCGMCGVCGVCAICAEVNAGSAAIAISAVTAVVQLQSETFAPQDRLRVALGEIPPPPDVERVLRAASAFGRELKDLGPEGGTSGRS
ncbi:MAG: hypothetical protein ACXW05_13460 [Gemmatirosa sp.]